MSEYIVDFDWMREYERNIELLIGEELEYDDATNPTPPLPRKNRITRCRDCAYVCNHEYSNGLAYHTCSYFDSRYAEVEPDGFCAWAERRDT